MPMADCGKCWLMWDPDTGQFDLEENPDCPDHGWSGAAIEALEGGVEDSWLDAQRSDSPHEPKQPPSHET